MNVVMSRRGARACAVLGFSLGLAGSLQAVEPPGLIAAEPVTNSFTDAGR